MDGNYADVVRLAEHYRAIGKTEIYLDRESEKPWSMATDVEGGCSYRLGQQTSVIFHAKHPCGVTFRWFFELEKDKANGRGKYEYDVKAVRTAMQRLPEAVAKKFADQLTQAAKAVRKLAGEIQQTADDQKMQAAALERILDA